LYTLVFTREFDRSFDKIKDTGDRKRIFSKVLELKDNPYLGKMLTGFTDRKYGRLFRLRVGKYRVIYAVVNDKIEIVLLIVGRRKIIYQ
jgi:mRNA-degrading endonuclease RelE of RelBE toxin-antitoxin system